MSTAALSPASLVRSDSENIIIKLHDKRHSKEAFDLLQEVQPSFVIMYDANPTLTRQLEMYAASRPGRALRIYFLVYEGSVEERSYLEDIELERKAFQQLIEHKSMMMGTERSNSQFAVPLSTTTSSPSREGRVDDTRRGGGGSGGGGGGGEGEVSHRRCVVVDAREFRSALPLMLHREGIEIVPMTLTVGDYILTPKICIERKSIPDLISSLKSGRLYKQAEQMCTHFEDPMLLIEFDDSRPFRLIDDLSRELTEYSIVSKLVLVLLHFPALHFLWMAHPRATASFFNRLKVNRDEPEDHIAAASNLTSGNAFDSTEGTAVHLTNQDTLRQVPGVTAGNFHRVIKKVKTLGELSRLSLGGMQELMGKVSGKRAFDFFNLKGVDRL